MYFVNLLSLETDRGYHHYTLGKAHDNALYVFISNAKLLFPRVKTG